MSYIAVLLLLIACENDNITPAEEVRSRIASVKPAFNFGHRGTGPTRSGHPFPENSISSFIAAIEQGANGIELDVQITATGEVIVMHDDTLHRTTDCTGCINEMSFEEVRACRLLDGEGNPTDERPPTLREVYAAVEAPALVNVEIKAIGSECLNDIDKASDLVATVLDVIVELGVAGRTLFSSFDGEMCQLLKEHEPQYYVARLYSNPGVAENVLSESMRLGFDALHPFLLVSPEIVTAAREAGLQVSVWTVNSKRNMEATLDKGVNAVITNVPGLLSELNEN